MKKLSEQSRAKNLGNEQRTLQAQDLSKKIFALWKECFLNNDWKTANLLSQEMRNLVSGIEWGLKCKSFGPM